MPDTKKDMQDLRVQQSFYLLKALLVKDMPKDYESAKALIVAAVEIVDELHKELERTK